MYYANDDVRLQEMPRPEITPGEVLIRIESSGVCGSDVMQWYRAGKTPLVLGHEVAGQIVEVGSDVGCFTPGLRVVAAHHVPCNTCHYCLTGHDTACDTLRTTKFYPGGFAQYLKLPAINVDRGMFVMPDSVSFDEGTFVEPLACVYRGQKAARVGLGKTVLVIGSGISGTLHISLARALGASRVFSTDIDPYRLAMARKIGADAAWSATEDIAELIKEHNGGRGADVVILTAGAQPAIEQAFNCVDRGGTILFFAPANQNVKVDLPVNDLFWRNEITLTSTYAANFEEHMTAMELIRSGRVDVKQLITHTLPLAQTQDGFKLVAEGKESIKVIIKPNE
jgi:L-iditol 2-dehydrogenase